MTRFEKEITGMLGDFWKKDAEARVSKIKDDFIFGRLLIEADGAAKWASNGHYIPDECIEYAIYAGLPVSKEATCAKEKAQSDAFFARYIKEMENHTPDPEELYEMRSAFGAGTTVVNVITGKAITL